MTQHYSNSLGYKIGYNGYVFDPTDWVDPRYPTRLSTCYGKFVEARYGSLTLERLTGLFYDFCPYEIIWQTKNDSLSIATVSNSNVPRTWMTENIRGYYRDLTWNHNVTAGSSLGIWRSCVKLQYEDDALLFKLTWVGND